LSSREKKQDLVEESHEHLQCEILPKPAEPAVHVYALYARFSFLRFSVLLCHLRKKAALPLWAWRETQDWRHLIVHQIKT
jgi:hypothetical protein